MDYLVHRVIKTGAGTYSGLQDGTSKHRPIVGRLGRDADLIVKRHHHHVIIGAKLVDERDRGILNLFQLETRRSAGVDYQGNREWFVSRRKVSNLLLNTILPNAKILFSQIGNVFAIAIH